MEEKTPKSQAMINVKDRISALPDSMICTILSNIPTKEAVTTSILSKRWKTQWTQCNTLDIDDSSLIQNHPLVEEDVVEVSFTNFIKYVIGKNKSQNIKKLQWSSELMKESDVLECLDLILMRNVEEIEFLNTIYDIPLQLPQKLFTCKNLVFLNIGSSAVLNIPESIHLPRLKVFRVNLYDPGEAVTTKLLCCGGGYPVLEVLSVTIYLYDLEEMKLNIFIPSLKRLSLTLDCEIENPYVYQIVVRAHSLKELDISDDFLAEYVFEELSLDLVASVEFGRCAEELDDDKLAARAVQLMNGISACVKSLTLSSYTLEILDVCNAFDCVAVFPNLTSLEMDVTDGCGWTYVEYFIDRLPSLVFLVLNMVPAHSVSRSSMHMERLGHVPQCLLLHLKKIEVRGFVGHEYGLKLLKFLLGSAKVLGEVVICTHDMALEERKNLHQRLSSFPNSSKNCQLKIV